MSTAVFVYADGTVGLRDGIPRHLQIYRQPRPRPMSLALRDMPTPVEFDCDEYAQRGLMYDGRPIFVASGYDVTEAAQETIASFGVDTRAIDHENRRAVFRFIEKECGEAIALDEQCGEWPLEESLRAKCLIKRGIRVMFAVRKA